MMKLIIFILLALISGLTYISAGKSSIGKAEKDQVLLWTEHKQTPINPVQTNLTHEFVFDGSDRNVERITLITFDYDKDSIYSSLSLDSGGPTTPNVKASFGCQECTYLIVTERIYGFYKTL